MRISSILGRDGQPMVIEERKPDVSSAWWQVFEAADRRDFRGWFYIPKLSPTDQMDWSSYRPIVERCDWMYNNIGAYRMVVDGLAADEASTGLWAKWVTGQDDYDKWMTDAVHFTGHDPRFFSASANDDAYSVQFNIRRMIRRYGDCFGQFVSINNLPLLHLIPGYMVENYGEEGEGAAGWIRGVLPDKFGRATRFRVLQSESSAAFLGSKASGYLDVAANDILHFHDPFFAGQLRGMPTGSSVAKKMFRREDIAKAIANGTLAREQLAWAIETQDQSAAGPAAFRLPGAKGVEKVTNPDGSTFNVQKLFGWAAQEQTKVPTVNGKLVTVESNRPGTQVMEFQDAILRELAYETIYPPDYVFFISGNGRRGSTDRLIIEKVRNVINTKREFQMKPQFCNRWNVYRAWQFIKSGAVERAGINVPENWWKHKINPPRDITIDLGRDGRLYDERVSTNKMSIETYHGLAGEDSGDVEDENLAVVDRRLIKLEKLNKGRGTTFTYFDIWPRTSAGGGDTQGATAQGDTVPGKATPGKTEPNPGGPPQQ